MSTPNKDTLMSLVLIGTLRAPAGLTVSKKTEGSGMNKRQVLPRMTEGLRRDTDRYILPSSTIAGSLRRALMDDIVQAKTGRGEALPYKSVLGFFALRVGGVAGFSGAQPVGYASALRAANPFISLWGKAGLAGRIGVPSAEAVAGASTIGRELGFRTDDVQRTPGVIEMLSPEMIAEYKALRVGAKGDKEMAKEALKSGDYSSTDSRFEEIVSGKGTEDEDTDAADKGLINIQNPYGGYEYFVPGTVFRHQIMLPGVTETEAALAVGALYAFARNPRVGGHQRDGLGWLDFDYQAMLISADPLQRQELAGKISVRAPVGFDDQTDGGLAEDLLAPRFTAEGQMKQLLDRYLELRSAGFPGMDFEAGAEEERETITSDNGGKSGKTRKKAGKTKEAAA